MSHMKKVARSLLPRLSFWVGAALADSVHKNQIQNIQALRAVAAVLVALVHMPPVLAMVGVDWGKMPLGHGGVDLFFVISGFVMIWSTADRAVGMVRFLASRAIRVVPLYWMASIIIYTQMVIRNSQAYPPPPISDLAKSLLFMPYENLPGKVYPVLYVGWTINLEMFFYFLFALCIFVPDIRWRVSLLTVILFSFVSLATTLAAPGQVALTFFGRPVIVEFAYGMGLALALKRYDWRPSRSAAFGIMTAGIAAYLVLPQIPMKADVFREIQFGIPALLVVLGAVTMERRGVFVKYPLVQLLGASSYAFYLFHPIILYALGGRVARMNISFPVVNGVLVVAACLSAFTVTAILVHLFVEAPMTRFLRRRLNAWLPPCPIASLAK